jgi:hypothetical protein
MRCDSYAKNSLKQGIFKESQGKAGKQINARASAIPTAAPGRDRPTVHGAPSWPHPGSDTGVDP